MTSDARFNDAAGTAALGICESLLLALIDRNVISEKDAHDLLTDVATKHEQASSTSLTPERHAAAVKIVQRLLVDKDGHAPPSLGSEQLISLLLSNPLSNK